MKHFSIVVVFEYSLKYNTFFFAFSAAFFQQKKKKRCVSTVKIAITNRIKFSTKLYELWLKKIRSSFITRHG